MNSLIKGSVFLSLLVVGGLLGTTKFSADAFAQEPAAESKDKQLDQTSDKKPRKEARGRVPTYFNDVIDGIQREKIYAIQKEYEAKLDKLRAELESVKLEMNQRIEETLRPDQKKRVGELRKIAADKREAARKLKEAEKAKELAEAEKKG